MNRRNPMHRSEATGFSFPRSAARGAAARSSAVPARPRRRFLPEATALEARELLTATFSVGLPVHTLTEPDPGTKAVYADFLVTLTGWSYGKTYSVSYAVTDGTAVAGKDYSISPSSNTLTFTTPQAGQILVTPTPIQQAVRVLIVGDQVGEATENFSLNLSNPSPSATITTPTAQATILDDDTPTLSVIPSLTVAENGGTAKVAVSLTNPSDRDVTVAVTTSDSSARAGRDYLAPTTTLTIPQGQLIGTISIPIIDNAIYDHDRGFQLLLSNPKNAALGQSSCQVTICDNEGPPCPSPRSRSARPLLPSPRTAHTPTWPSTCRTPTTNPSL